MADFVKVARAGEIAPGEAKAVEAGGKRIAIFGSTLCGRRRPMLLTIFQYPPPRLASGNSRPSSVSNLRPQFVGRTSLRLWPSLRCQVRPKTKHYPCRRKLRCYLQTGPCQIFQRF
jgi:hypothetical protein